MFPLIHINFYGDEMKLVTPPELQNVTLNNSQWGAAYKTAVLKVVRAVHPLYLSIGNEVNRWYEQYGMNVSNLNRFQHYVNLYKEIYDAVKNISPQTMVFCVFAREIVAENREADLTVLTLFNHEKLDMLVFTSYPFAVQGISKPSDIPDDYYRSAAAYMLGRHLDSVNLGGHL